MTPVTSRGVPPIGMGAEPGAAAVPDRRPAGPAGTPKNTLLGPVGALHDAPANERGVVLRRDPAAARRLVEDLLGRLKRLQAGRGVWESHWQELAEFMLPRRAGFSREQTPGAKRTERQYDGAPMQAARGLAASLDGMLKPRTATWFSLRAADPDLNRRAEVRRWLEDAERRLRNALYDPRARFLQRSGEVDLDLVVFGTGVLYVGEKVGERRLLFRAHHLRGVYLAEDADGEIDTVFRVFRLTARQAAQAFGADAIGEKTREALRDGNPEAEFDFLHAVYPRHGRDRAALGQRIRRYRQRTPDLRGRLRRHALCHAALGHRAGRGLRPFARHAGAARCRDPEPDRQDPAARRSQGGRSAIARPR